MKTGIRIVVFAVLLVGAGIYLVRYTSESRLRREHNAVIADLVDQGRYQEAIRRLEPLENRGSKDIQAAVRNSLATAYAGWADAESATPQQRVERLRKAREFDPAVLSDDDRALLERVDRTTP